MAGTIPARLTCKLRDVNGIKASATAYGKLLSTATVTQAETVLTDWLTLMEAVTAADIVEGEIAISIKSSPAGDTNADLADSNCIETAVLDFAVPSNGRTWGFAVPARKDSLVVAGKLVVDTGAVNELGAGMGTTTNFDFYTNDYVALGSLKSGFPTGRKRRGVRTSGRGLA